MWALRFALAALALGTVAARSMGQSAPITAVPASAVSIDDGFWAPRLRTSRDKTLPHALASCADRVRNLERVAGQREGGFEGPYPFDDSDLYKVIEGVANHLALHDDPTLRKELDSLTAKIAAAQQDDGYLYTARQLDCPQLRDWIGDDRWSKLRGSHELYDLGHLIEAGVAAFEATGERGLLDVAQRAADCIDASFGPTARKLPSGHPEVELALVRLARTTGEPRYLELARFLLDQRGHTEDREGYGAYAQDDVPLVDASEAVGHAVRGAYLYAAMADVAMDAHDEALGAAVDRLWHDVVGRHLYVTGGIGARGAGEAFGDAYELPNAAAYCETCAAIALANWAHRMFLRSGDAGPIDVLERAIFNNVLSGVSLDGLRYFYPNPLASDGRSRRSDWFACACCPSNLARFIPSIGRFAYATRGDDTLFVNLYIAGGAQVTLGTSTVALSVDTRYPWDGAVELRVASDAPRRFSLRLRVPGWARQLPVPSDLYAFCDHATEPVRLAVDGEREDVDLDHGYAVVDREWRDGDTVTLDLPMPVRRLRANAAVTADHGLLAIERGPIVYCVEGIDIGDTDHLAGALVVDPASPLEAVDDQDLLGGCVTVHGEGRIARRALDGDARLSDAVAFDAIPYALWAQRAPASMAVWLATGVTAAQPAPAPTLAHRSHASASFHAELCDALSDQLDVTTSADKSRPHLHFWPHKGGAAAAPEWVEYEFPGPTAVAGCDVFWMADVPNGECELPKSWRVLCREGESWRPVELDGGAYPITRDAWDRVRFAPVTTDALRLEVTLRDGLSAGIHEWRVDPAD